MPPQPLIDSLRKAVNRNRMVDTLVELVKVPSRTGEAGPVSDRLAEILRTDGFTVERPVGGHPAAPAVAVRFDTGKPGRTLQFNGHLDVVHLPFVPPTVEGDLVKGSGSCDMKGGTVAAIEALRVLRDTGALAGGSILFTAHDLHEAPWGLGEQLNQLIRDGWKGDAVLLPEPITDKLPAVGRGASTWRAFVRRNGPPVHEVMRPMNEPSVIAAGAELVARLGAWDKKLSAKRDPDAGCESAFIGQIHSGEIYNQYPQVCFIEGTRRWLPTTSRDTIEPEFRKLLADTARDTGTSIDCEFRIIRDAFRLNLSHPIVSTFQACHAATVGKPLPIAPKPFVDDGNSFWGIADVPTITHGPKAGGQHTVEEWVSIDDMVRVAHLYALTAVEFCPGK